MTASHARRDRDMDRRLNDRDKALLVLAGVIVIVAMACTTALVILADAAGVAAAAGVFGAGCTVAGAAVGRLGPARNEPGDELPPAVDVIVEDPGDGIFTAVEEE